ncbi:MAG: HAD family hydrolase [Sphaerochaetaceae bacterium]
MKKKVSAVLIDLDGTLLPMDHQLFLSLYMAAFETCAQQALWPVQKATLALQQGIRAMQANNGRMTNEKVFAEVFSSFLGIEEKKWHPVFETFYQTQFPQLQQATKQTPWAAYLVNLLNEHTIPLVLATNPVFPKTATIQRLRWAGLKESQFDIITTYEEYSFCKPNSAYYEQILKRMGLKAQQALMIGNDVTEDMVAARMGMDHFLVTDNMLNSHNEDISVYRQGSLQKAYQYCLRLVENSNE